MSAEEPTVKALPPSPTDGQPPSVSAISEPAKEPPPPTDGATAPIPIIVEPDNEARTPSVVNTEPTATPATSQPVYMTPPQRSDSMNYLIAQEITISKDTPKVVEVEVAKEDKDPENLWDCIKCCCVFCFTEGNRADGVGGGHIMQ